MVIGFTETGHLKNGSTRWKLFEIIQSFQCYFLDTVLQSCLFLFEICIARLFINFRHVARTFYASRVVCRKNIDGNPLQKAAMSLATKIHGLHKRFKAPKFCATQVDEMKISKASQMYCSQDVLVQMHQKLLSFKAKRIDVRRTLDACRRNVPKTLRS